MNLKFWSWELKFWTLLVLRISVSHRWFPSLKQINGFQNQNPCENLNRTSFARTSWFLVKVHIKANSCRIILFEQFRIPEWRNRPQKMESTRKIRQDRSFLKIFTFWSTFGNWTFAQFLTFEWRNGSQNRNVLEKLSGTGHFWKFWLFGQSQSSTWSKLFLFLFFLFNFFFNRRFGPGQDEWVKPNRPRQTGQTVVGGDIIALEGTCSTCKRVAGWGDTWNWCYERQCHWRRVEACGSFFGLKFFWALSI